MEKVSVIIPCYNQSQYLVEAIESVNKSTYKNIEIIVINDGSVDVSPEKLQDMLSNFNNIILINQKNSGVCAARNKGINISTGTYILPLDADDKIAETYIEKAVNILEGNPDIGLVYCEAEYFSDTLKENKKWDLKPATTENMLIQNRIFSSTLFRKSKFMETAGYNSSMELGCEDWDLWLSIIETGSKIYQIPEVLFYYRESENIRTKKSLKPLTYLKIRYNIVKAHRKLYNKYGLKIYLKLVFMVCKNLAYNFYKLIRRGN